MSEDQDIEMAKQPSPIDILQGIYQNKLNNNPKSLAASLFQHVIEVCDHLKELENEWMKFHYSKGYRDGIADFKDELIKEQQNDTSRTDH